MDKLTEFCKCAQPEPALIEHGLASLCEKCGQYIGPETQERLLPHRESSPVLIPPEQSARDPLKGAWRDPEAQTEVLYGVAYCSNWPCRLLKYHDGPCSSSERRSE